MIKKFKPAIEGLIVAFKDKSCLIQILLAFIALIFAILLDFNYLEMIVVLLCIGLVIVSEIINTALETLCNKVEINEEPLIKKAKDLAAGAVLLACLVAIIVGIIIIFNKFN